MRSLNILSIMVGCIFFFASPVVTQSTIAKCDPSLRLSQMQHTQPKGRLQDAGAPQTLHILDLGTINGVVNWETLKAAYPDSPSSVAWYEFVRKHSRRYVQNNWSEQWRKEQFAVVWDAKQHCFKVSQSATQRD
jgi:hypothetical protein